MELVKKLEALFKEYGYEWEKDPEEIHPWLYRGRDMMKQHRIDTLTAENERLREALDAIADNEWPSDYDACDMYEACVEIARTALSGTSDTSAAGASQGKKE